MKPIDSNQFSGDADRDTSEEAGQFQDQLYRAMSAAKKFELICNAYETGKQLAMAGLRLRHPDASEEQIWRLWARQHLGNDLYDRVYGTHSDAVPG